MSEIVTWKQRHTYPTAEIFTLPLLYRGLRLEVAEIFKVKSLIATVQFCRPFFSPCDDCIYVGLERFPDDKREPGGSNLKILLTLLHWYCL